MTQLDDAIHLIEEARTPADLFGRPDGDSAARRYRLLARLTHPDTVHDGRAAAAARAFARLTALWSDFRQQSSPITLTTSRRTYELGPLVATGDIAGLYRVRSDRPETTALLKLPRDPAHSDLLAREATALAQLVKDGDARFRPYAPRLIETFRHRDAATGTTRQANVIELLDGFFSLAEVRAAYPDGLDPRDVAWMWRRLLVGLGYAHRSGVIHGAVLPEHVLIHPGDHGLVLVDWCGSVPGCYATTDPTGRVPLVLRRYAGGDHYPPEVLDGQPACPATDVYMATRCMTDLLAEPAPGELRMFARGCTLAAPSRRPADAWRLLGELDELLERLYGPRRFRAFAMPAKAE